MPGPVALKRREYYGFPGNHFWPILSRLFGGKSLPTYREKLRLLKARRLALWDVIHSCERVGASDSAIRCIRSNPVPSLLRRYPGIRAVFLNGKTAEKLYRKHFGGKISLPCYTLPSTSPAHASMPFEKKLKQWSKMLNYLPLDNRRRLR